MRLSGGESDLVELGGWLMGCHLLIQVAAAAVKKLDGLVLDSHVLKVGKVEPSITDTPSEPAGECIPSQFMRQSIPSLGHQS